MSSIWHYYFCPTNLKFLSWHFRFRALYFREKIQLTLLYSLFSKEYCCLMMLFLLWLWNHQLGVLFGPTTVACNAYMGQYYVGCKRALTCLIIIRKYDLVPFSQYGNFRIFLSFRFYVKSIVEYLEVLKLPFFAILEGFNFC